MAIVDLKNGPAVLCVECANVPKAVSVVDLELKERKASIVELSVISPGRLFAILNASEGDLKTIENNLQIKLETDLIQVHFFKSIDSEVWDAFYGLAKPALQSAIVAAESGISVDCVSLAQKLYSDCGVIPIEIRTSRGQGSISTYFGTVAADQRVVVEKVLKEFSGRVSSAFLENPSLEIRKLFEI